MPLEIKKRERESSQNLVRRFARRIQQSGILLRARNARFKKRQKSRNMKKRAALRRAEIKIEKERLKKLGKIER